MYMYNLLTAVEKKCHTATPGAVNLIFVFCYRLCVPIALYARAHLDLLSLSKGGMDI